MLHLAPFAAPVPPGMNTAASGLQSVAIRKGEEDPPSESTRIPLVDVDDSKPDGWRGSLTPFDAMIFEIAHAASWNDRPGDTRVHIDWTGFITFYDPALISLINARKGHGRFYHRLLSISSDDASAIRQELAEVLGRASQPRSPRTMRVDWGSITSVVMERYGERLTMLKYITQEGQFRNLSRQVSIYRTQLLIILGPYMVTHAIPAVDADPTVDVSWASPIIEHCATSQTSHIDLNSLTEQERRIMRAVADVLRGICQTLGALWIRAFDLESQDMNEKAEVLRIARSRVEDLMGWLDWPMWIGCELHCGPEVSSQCRPKFGADEVGYRKPATSLLGPMRCSKTTWMI